jgi:hypothetical protein
MFGNTSQVWKGQKLTFIIMLTIYLPRAGIIHREGDHPFLEPGYPLNLHNF